MENNFEPLLAYDWIMIPVWGGFYDFIFRLKVAHPSVKILGVTDIEMQAIQYAPRAEIVKLIKIIKLLDIVLCSNPDFIKPLQKIRPDIYNLGGWCIFPHKHRSVIKDPVLKDKNQIAIGCSNCGYNRNIFENFLVFKELVNYNPAFTGFYWNVLPEHREDIIRIADELGISNSIILLPEASDWGLFLKQYSDMFISIHLYTFKVVSRLAQDAMALGIPHIGCYSNYADRKFCPASVQEWDIDGAIKNAIKLYEDSKYYDDVRNEQFSHVSYYDEQSVGTRIISAIEDYEHKRK